MVGMPTMYSSKWPRTGLLIRLSRKLIRLIMSTVPQTASAVRGSHDLAKGRLDIYAQISVGGLAPGDLPRTCPTLAPHLPPACPQHAVWGLCSGVILLRGGRMSRAKIW